MPLESGQILSHYRLVEQIGEGGMGVVWRAQDTKLDRDVAVKFLPEAFSEDPDRLARFEREAKLLASLNHPNIAAIHGLEDANGVRFLVLELIPGDTLAERVARGPLAVEDALRFGRQIAEALEVAHSNGVLHRDLKPANVKVTPDGTVKVLDFGLAKPFAADSSSTSLSLSPTITTARTREGVILGTAAYMSPEQARGRAVDKRTDIWALGCVLFEMLSGRQVFGGETASDTIASILKSPPDWTALPGTTPLRVRELVQRCLEKDLRNRLHDAADARIELERCLAAAGSASSMSSIEMMGEARSTSTRRAGLGVIAATAVAGAMVGALLWSQLGPALAPTGAGELVTRLSIEIPHGVEVQAVFPSPDGRRVVYRARSAADPEGGEPVTQLFVRSLDDFEAHALPDSERATWAAISPDSRWVAYYTSNRSGGGGKIKKVALAGGPPLVLLEVPAPPGGWMDGEWRADDTLLLSLDGGSRLARLSTDGGEPQTVLELDQAQETSVVLGTASLPDSDSFLLNVGFVGKDGLQSRIEVVSLQTGERRTLLDDGYALIYLAGDLVFDTVTDNVLRAAQFDVEKLKLTGPERPLMSFSGAKSLSRTGTLVHVPGRETSHRIVLVDRQGVIEPLAEMEGTRARRVRWSPDGRRLGMILRDQERFQNDLWTYELSRGTLSPLRFREKYVDRLAWTPDGTSLAFSALTGTSGYHIYQRDADGQGEPRLIIEPSPNENFLPTSWSPDGSLLAIVRSGSDRRPDIWLLPGEEGAEPVQFLTGPSSERNAIFSPDGRWIAFDSDESGKRELYVCPYRSGDERPRARWRVSTGGGKDVVWSPDGAELFFEDARERLMVVSFRPPSNEGGAPTLGTPEVLLDLAALDLLSGLTQSYDIHPDGSRFVFFQEQVADDAPQSIRVVVNWYQDVAGKQDSH